MRKHVDRPSNFKGLDLEEWGFFSDSVLLNNFHSTEWRHVLILMIHPCWEHVSI